MAHAPKRIENLQSAVTRFVMRELYENGVWAIFSTLDPHVLEFKPGRLFARELCEVILDRLKSRWVGRGWLGDRIGHLPPPPPAPDTPTPNGSPPRW